MTTQKEMSKINRLVELIKREGVISKVHLIMKSGLSISYYNNLKPFLEEIYPHLVQYDKETKLWKYIKVEDVDDTIPLEPEIVS